ncbi:MAG TPA: UDP-glucose 4-epimerase GalE [Acidobacteriota bacterium]|nr:UDP-glucose 4-epimerase GalE [Acidobacteriota bacterium]
MKSLLITGGAGYIGSHAVLYFLDQKWHVTVLDSFERGSVRIEGADYIEGKTGDPEIVRKVCRKQKFDAVMHFAAYASVEESVRRSDVYERNNITGTQKFIEVLIEEGIRKFIFSSSAAVYGETSEPVTEESETKPCNPYGESKMRSEQFLSRCAKSGDLNFVSLRYFNAAGNDPEGRTGETHDPELHLIPNIFRAHLQGKPVRVHGDDYSTPDGTCIRDFVHVCDLVAAHALALNSLLDGGPSAIYNVGTGKGYSIREVIRQAGSIARKEIAFEVVPRRPGDPAFLVASAEKIQRELGWKPKFGLREILETAYNWEIRRLHTPR